MATLIQGDGVGKAGKIRTSSLVAIFNADHTKILLTRRQDNGRFCLPGGGIEPGESAAQAAMREVKEEVGLDVQITKLVGVYSSPDYLIRYADGNQYQYVSMLFEASVIGGKLGLSDEVSQNQWSTLDELKDVDIMEHQVGRIMDAFANQEAAFIQ